MQHRLTLSPVGVAMCSCGMVFSEYADAVSHAYSSNLTKYVCQNNLPPGMTHAPGDGFEHSPGIVQEEGGEAGLDYKLNGRAWLSVGPLSLCLQEGEPDSFMESTKHCRIEVFALGHEDGDPVARLEIPYQLASIYNNQKVRP
jgi:hypothetical protein